jgi:hypothetical protein
MKSDYAARVRAGIILVVVFALYSNLHLLLASAVFDPSQIGKDEITLYERRFDEVRKRLPSHGTVGYLGSGLTNPDGSPNDLSLRNWYLAQYSVAPLVLSTLPGNRIFLINRNADVSLDPSAKDDLTVEELGRGNKILNFGNGVKLLSTESQ